jgi:hypothetical protein
MFQAYIIESGEIAAGIVTREKRGFLFHAATHLFRTLDGQTFSTTQQAQRAVENLRRAKRSTNRSGH